MHCQSCMTVNPMGNRFCESCGSKLQLACPKCGHDITPFAHYCGNCGSSRSDVITSSAPRESAPKWGELKQATVLFADIVGSTELVANLDPEQAMGRLRPAVLIMRHSIERFGGTVARTLGDGVMAMFGVPRALEGHALLACQAALHMQKAFSQGSDGLSIRIGLHSGQIASDPQDAQDGRGGGAHGLTIHLASRISAFAPSGGICLTSACRDFAGHACETLSLGVHQLKGIPQNVEILSLASVSPGLRRRGAIGPVASTFRGRHAEIEKLTRYLHQAGDHAAKAVGVVGEPGAGKSRLCDEFAQQCRARAVPVFDVRAQLYGHALPLQPILQLFRVHFFGIRESDDDVVARARIEKRLEAIELKDGDLALLYEFFGVMLPGSLPLALGARARQTRLLSLMKSVVCHQADEERVILIEDLHWLDEASEEFVAALVEAVAGTRTLLLLNYRPSYRSPWLEVRHFEEVELHELPAADMDAMVSELLAPLTSMREVGLLVRERSGGNPFFAEELVRSISESGLLAADSGRPLGGLDALERALPDNIQAVISARLDRIGEPEKTLLQMCAIIGKEIPLAVLEHVASPLAAQIEKGLDGLCRAGLILPQSSSGGRRFAFRHPLIQEVAYGTQLKGRRGQVHCSVAIAMELYDGAQSGEYAALIAYHYEQGNQNMPAARHNARAARWVGSTNAAQAIKHWRKVRHLLEPLQRDVEGDQLRVAAGAKIALLGWREGLTYEEVKPLIDDALRLSNQADDRLVPWLLTIEGRMLVAGGGAADGYVECVKKALLYIDVERDAGRVGVAHAFLSQAYAWAGLLREALVASDVALANMPHVDPLDRDFMGFSIEQWVLGVRARILIRMNRLDDARKCLDEVVDKEAMSSESPVPGMSRFGFIELAWAVQDVGLARSHEQELLHLTKKHVETPYVHAFLHGYKALALSIAGEHGLALDGFGDALELVRRTGAAKEFETEILAGMAECLLRLGRPQESHARATEAIDLSRLRTTRVAQCRALITRGEATLALTPQEGESTAHEDFDRADQLLFETGASVWQGALISARRCLNSESAR